MLNPSFCIIFLHLHCHHLPLYKVTEEAEEEDEEEEDLANEQGDNLEASDDDENDGEEESKAPERTLEDEVSVA